MANGFETVITNAANQDSDLSIFEISLNFLCCSWFNNIIRTKQYKIYENILYVIYLFNYDVKIIKRYENQFYQQVNYIHEYSNLYRRLESKLNTSHCTFHIYT